MGTLLQTLKEYADVITALAALIALLVAIRTLLFVQGEHKNKYRPYLVPVPEIGSREGGGYNVILKTRNVGPHPCELKLSEIKLQIGDEIFDTPNVSEWILIAPNSMAVGVPIGSVFQAGIDNVRQGRYRHNRIEVSFKLFGRSIDHKYSSDEAYAYEILVTGNEPQVVFRSEWHKRT